MTWKRVATAVVLIPIVVALDLYCSTAVVSLAIALVTLLALFEYFALGDAIGHRAYRFWTATCALGLIYAHADRSFLCLCSGSCRADPLDAEAVGGRLALGGNQLERAAAPCVPAELRRPASRDRARGAVAAALCSGYCVGWGHCRLLCGKVHRQVQAGAALEPEEDLGRDSREPARVAPCGLGLHSVD